MKKLLFILAFLVQTLIVSASNQNSNHKAAVSRVSTENVKMYSQAGTSTDVLRSLKSTDEVMVVRKHNAQWSIVTVEGQVGYVLTSELVQPEKVRKVNPKA